MASVLLPKPTESFASNTFESLPEPGEINSWTDDSDPDSSDIVADSDSDDPDYVLDSEPDDHEVDMPITVGLREMISLIPKP